MEFYFGTLYGNKICTMRILMLPLVSQYDQLITPLKRCFQSFFTWIYFSLLYILFFPSIFKSVSNIILRPYILGNLQIKIYCVGVKLALQQQHFLTKAFLVQFAVLDWSRCTLYIIMQSLKLFLSGLMYLPKDDF